MRLLNLIDKVWHRGPYQLTVRWANRLHLYIYTHVCTPVANWETKEKKQ